jgi:hypothetical protein
VDQVLAVDRPIAERAKQIVLGYQQLSARFSPAGVSIICRTASATS